VLCHGFPSGVGGAKTSARTFPELADRIANEMGWVALTFNFRGCGESEGSFSLKGWLADLRAAIAEVRANGASTVWLAGFGTGGALAVCAGARDPSVGGVAAMAAPADFDDWATHPRRLLDHAREIGMIREPGFPASFEGWARELREIRAVACAVELVPRPLLVVHGSDDEQVPVFDARVLADAHGGAEIRVVGGSGHRLRHDPRAVAVLLGWLERHRNLRASRPAGAPPTR
jgi:putative redox protein